MIDSHRLSFPVAARRLPRSLSERELRGLMRSADVLIPGSGVDSPASQTPGFEAALLRALAARIDAFELIVVEGDRLGPLTDKELAAELRRLAATEPATFQPLSTVLAGAYLLIPEVREAIGYPGQHREHAQFDEAANEIMDGILDPVIDRGPIYKSA